MGRSIQFHTFSIFVLEKETLGTGWKADWDLKYP
jgi:hypothetical protein